MEREDWFSNIGFFLFSGYCFLNLVIAYRAYFGGGFEVVFLLFGFVPLTILMSHFFCKNIMNALVPTLVMLGICSISRFGRQYAVLLLVICVAILLFIILLITANKGALREKKVMKRRIISRIVEKSIRSVSFFLAVFMVSVVIDQHVIPLMVTSKQVGGESLEIDAPLSDGELKKTIEIINDFDKKIWRTLSVDKRISDCEEILKLEIRHLGIPHELSLCVSELADRSEDTQGMYVDASKTIFIRKSLLDSEKSDPIELIRVLTHEVYHAYCGVLLEVYEIIPDEQKHLLIFRDAKQFDNEINNIGYIDAESDIISYYGQLYERRAREYSESRAIEYKNVSKSEDDAAYLLKKTIL